MQPQKQKIEMKQVRKKSRKEENDHTCDSRPYTATDMSLEFKKKQKRFHLETVSICSRFDVLPSCTSQFVAGFVYCYTKVLLSQICVGGRRLKCQVLRTWSETSKELYASHLIEQP
jgi:hypothetical protein